MPRMTLRSRAIIFSTVTAIAVAGCAGGVDLLDLPEPTGEHPFPVRSATTGKNSHEVHGIDIAKYQGDIDWYAVKRSGIAFAFIKATEGGDILDNRFHENWAGAKAAGVPRGAYHFNYWCTPMEKQFAWFKRHVPADKDAMPPVLDLEWNTHSPTCPKKVPRHIAQAEIRKFVRLAEAHYGKRPILYTDIRFYRDVLSDGSFSRYPLWVRATRRLPQDIYEGRRWAFWQYTGRGRVEGIRGKVDRNVFAGTKRQWRQLVASNFMQPPGASPLAGPDPVKKPNPVPASPPVVVAENDKPPGGPAAALRAAGPREGAQAKVRAKVEPPVATKPNAPGAGKTGGPVQLLPAVNRQTSPDVVRSGR